MESRTGRPWTEGQGYKRFNKCCSPWTEGQGYKRFNKCCSPVQMITPKQKPVVDPVWSANRVLAKICLSAVCVLTDSTEETRRLEDLLFLPHQLLRGRYVWIQRCLLTTVTHNVPLMNQTRMLFALYLILFWGHSELHWFNQRLHSLTCSTWNKRRSLAAVFTRHLLASYKAALQRHNSPSVAPRISDPVAKPGVGPGR